MSDVYAEIGSNLQYIGGELPDGWIVMERQRPEGNETLMYTAQADGTWAITEETINAKKAVVELSWREEQMPIAQQAVTALTYGETGIPGTVDDWQKYWLSLRKWTVTNPDFPDSTKRPVAPNA